MAAVSLIEQVIIFISPDRSFDEAGILSDPSIQAVAANSAGNDIVIGYKNFVNIVGGVATTSSLFELRFYISPGFQAAVQAGIPTLAAAWPTYGVTTWGAPVSFGF